MRYPGVKAGLIDRLMGIEGDAQAHRPGYVTESAYVSMAARDIERLLNTRNVRKNLGATVGENAPEDFGTPGAGAARNQEPRLIDSSILMYGLPDFSALSLANGKDRQTLADEVSKAIRTFDRRFSHVEVRLADGSGVRSSLHFAIRARLRMAGRAAPVGFEALFQSTTLQFSVSPENNRRT